MCDAPIGTVKVDVSGGRGSIVTKGKESLNYFGFGCFCGKSNSVVRELSKKFITVYNNFSPKPSCDHSTCEFSTMCRTSTHSISIYSGQNFDPSQESA